MNTRTTILKAVAAASLFGAIGLAQAQIFIAVPFPPSAPIPNNAETFDAIAPGSYMSFPAMGGAAGVARIGTGGLLMIDNAILPGLSLPNSCWGRGVDVQWRFQSLKRFFGGFFRVPNAGVAVNAMIVRFWNGAAPVGAAVMPVNNAAWQWRGWYVPARFDRVEIFGNGGTPGYVGMDNVRVRN